MGGGGTPWGAIIQSVAGGINNIAGNRGAANSRDMQLAGANRAIGGIQDWQKQLQGMYNPYMQGGQSAFQNLMGMAQNPNYWGGYGGFKPTTGGGVMPPVQANQAPTTQAQASLQSPKSFGAQGDFRNAPDLPGGFMGNRRAVDFQPRPQGGEATPGGWVAPVDTSGSSGPGREMGGLGVSMTQDGSGGPSGFNPGFNPRGGMPFVDISRRPGQEPMGDNRIINRLPTDRFGDQGPTAGGPQTPPNTGGFNQQFPTGNYPTGNDFFSSLTMNQNPVWGGGASVGAVTPDEAGLKWATDRAQAAAKQALAAQGLSGSGAAVKRQGEIAGDLANKYYMDAFQRAATSAQIANQGAQMGLQAQLANQGNDYNMRRLMLEGQGQLFGQDLANRNYGLASNQQGFMQGLQNRQFDLSNRQFDWSQVLGNREYDQALRNQQIGLNQWLANMGWGATQGMGQLGTGLQSQLGNLYTGQANTQAAAEMAKWNNFIQGNTNAANAWSGMFGGSGMGWDYAGNKQPSGGGGGGFMGGGSGGGFGK